MRQHLNTSEPPVSSQFYQIHVDTHFDDPDQSKCENSKIPKISKNPGFRLIRVGEIVTYKAKASPLGGREITFPVSIDLVIETTASGNGIILFDKTEEIPVVPRCLKAVTKKKNIPLQTSVTVL